MCRNINNNDYMHASTNTTGISFDGQSTHEYLLQTFFRKGGTGTFLPGDSAQVTELFLTDACYMMTTDGELYEMSACWTALPPAFLAQVENELF